jgi:hypothetical protein
LLQGLHSSLRLWVLWEDQEELLEEEEEDMECLPLAKTVAIKKVATTENLKIAMLFVGWLVGLRVALLHTIRKGKASPFIDDSNCLS